MNFGPGDMVVCIDTKPIIPGEVCEQLTWGNEYTVHSVHADRCISLIGHTFDAPVGMEVGCNFCSARASPSSAVEHFHFLGWRFVKLDKILIEDADFQELSDIVNLMEWAQKEIRRRTGLPDELLEWHRRKSRQL